MKQVLKHLVEPPNATEAGCERHVRYRHFRFVKKLFCEKHSSGLSHR